MLINASQQRTSIRKRMDAEEQIPIHCKVLQSLFRASLLIDLERLEAPQRLSDMPSALTRGNHT